MAALDRSKAHFDKARAALRAQAERMPGRRPGWLLAVIATVGLFVGFGFLGFLFSLLRHRDHREDEYSATPTVSPATSAPSSPVVSGSAAPPPGSRP